MSADAPSSKLPQERRERSAVKMNESQKRAYGVKSIHIIINHIMNHTG